MKTTTPWLILALGLMLSLRAGPPTAGPPVVTAVGPERVDFGRYPARDRKEAGYGLRNDGGMPLHILSIRKNCGCAEAKASRMELPPGEETRITAVILADSIHGPYTKNVVVETDDPKCRFVTFTLSGQAVPVATVKPAAVLYAGRLPVGKTWRQEFRIEPGPDTPDLALGEPTATGNYPVTAALQRSPDGTFRLAVEVRPEQAVGDLSCLIRMPVETPDGWGPVQITVAAKVGMEFRAIPERMFLTATDGTGAERTFHLRLLGPEGTALDPVAISWDAAPPGVSFRLGEVAGNTVPVTLAYDDSLVAALRTPNPPRIVFRHPGAAPATLVLLPAP
jgi:hypothetical protein